jgi:hypothetical protein
VQTGRGGGVGLARDAVEVALEGAGGAQQADLELGDRHPAAAARCAVILVSVGPVVEEGGDDADGDKGKEAEEEEVKQAAPAAAADRDGGRVAVAVPTEAVAAKGDQAPAQADAVKGAGGDAQGRGGAAVKRDERGKMMRAGCG